MPVDCVAVRFRGSGRYTSKTVLSCFIMMKGGSSLSRRAKYRAVCSKVSSSDRVVLKIEHRGNVLQKATPNPVMTRVRTGPPFRLTSELPSPGGLEIVNRAHIMMYTYIMEQAGRGRCASQTRHDRHPPSATEGYVCHNAGNLNLQVSWPNTLISGLVRRAKEKKKKETIETKVRFRRKKVKQET